ncbi:MAG: hypothetical protein LBK07_00290 [Tannerella sp.]|jgi:hypothetical protein|nr:hypothetical protein [Tannerella sp.]
MNVDEQNQTEVKPFIIANPIYDTVFKKLMENRRIVTFFLSTILECPVTAIEVLPQEFTHVKKTDKDGGMVPYSIFRVDFMATVQTGDGKYGKILIEVQKSLGLADVNRFRQYLGEQYSKRDLVTVNNGVRELSLPITTIYILGTRLAKIKCSCLKVERTYTDMVENEPVAERDDFVEKLTHNSYFIQAGRITDNRYSTHLEKLLSIFEQSDFVGGNSEVLKEYRYRPDVEEIKIITDVLHEMGVDPEERKRIENEAEFIRTIDDTYGAETRELTETVREQAKLLEEKARSLEEQAKEIAELKRRLTGNINKQNL